MNGQTHDDALLVEPNGATAHQGIASWKETWLEVVQKRAGRVSQSGRASERSPREIWQGICLLARQGFMKRVPALALP